MPNALIIDDDHDICFSLNKFITKHGFVVREAMTSRRALEIIDQVNDLDVVLCDYKLYGTDGKAMLIRIKENYPRLPVIIITGYNDLKTALEVMKMGAHDYILKPFFPEEILNTIQSALQQNNAYTPSQKPVSAQPALGKSVPPAQHEQYIFDNSQVFQQLIKQISLVGFQITLGWEQPQRNVYRSGI